MSKKYSESQIKANHKYNKKTYKRVSLYVKNEEMTVVEDFCKNGNYSKNHLFIEAVKEKIERKTGTNFQDLSAQTQPAKETETAKSAEASGTEKGEE